MPSASGYKGSGGTTPPPTPPQKKGFFRRLRKYLKWTAIASTIAFLGYEAVKTSDQVTEERLGGLSIPVRYASNCLNDILKAGTIVHKKLTNDDTPIQSAPLDYVYIALPENAPDSYINEARVEIENIARHINRRDNYYHNGIYAGTYPIIIVSDDFNASADTPKTSIRTSTGPDFDDLDHSKVDIYKMRTGRYSKNEITFVMD